LKQHWAIIDAMILPENAGILIILIKSVQGDAHMGEWISSLKDLGPVT
jgi:hypothetical protein